jgi:CRISPR-associated protein Csh1
MIKELINFTNKIIEDFPSITSINQKPNKGLHVFVEIDKDGNWVNQSLEKGKDYNFYDGKNDDFPLWKDCIKYQGVSDYITMNKVQKFDSKQKIHSCSPFAIAFNFNFNEKDMVALGIKQWKKGEKPNDEEKEENENLIRKERIKVVKERIDDYKKNAYKLHLINEDFNYLQIVEAFYRNISLVLDKISLLDDFSRLTTKDYLRVVLKSVPFEIQELMYKEYLETEIFNDEKLSHKDFGIIGAINDYPDKKEFLKHQTASFIKGIGQRYSREEALIMDNFKKIMSKNILPKPLPIFIYQEELHEEIRIIKKGIEDGEKFGYREIIEKIHEKHQADIGDYYLLYHNGKEIKDFDFVAKFEYSLKDQSGKKWEILDLFNGGNAQIIKNVFHFQLAVLQPVFNNNLITKTKNDTYQYKYFDDFESKYCKSDITYIQILKYRRAFYDFIYKSIRQAITSPMFDEIMQTSILEDIRLDEIKNNFHSEERNIRQKLNIWFSLTNNFINAKNNQVMSSKLQTHREFIKQLADGKTDITTDEQYAFTVGQVIYYLLSKSKTADRSYKRLEPFMQQVQSKELNKSIARLFDSYKHENFSGNFRAPFAQILSYETKTTIRDLIPTILSGVFSDNALFSNAEKPEETITEENEN